MLILIAIPTTAAGGGAVGRQGCSKGPGGHLRDGARGRAGDRPTYHAAQAKAECPVLS